jgi:hypothetical protein
MKIFVSFSVLALALSFCNLSERLSSLPDKTTSTNTNSSNTNISTNTATMPSTTIEAEKPSLTDAQNAALQNGKPVTWEDQKITWTLPGDWKKISSTKNTFQYGSSNQAFLIGTISPVADNFPLDVSLQSYYDGAVQRRKNNEVEIARFLELDGIKGVEFIETNKEDTSEPRRHQWIGFRKYNGQIQMLNIMLSTKSSNFEKNRDVFKAIMYSMKIDKY